MAMQGRPAPTPDHPPPSSTSLLEDAYRTNGSAVLGYALRRTASREDALDVVAETFATAWRRRDDVPVDADEIRPWLFGIARRCLANTVRGTRRAARLGERLAAAFGETGACIPDPAGRHDEDGRLHEALELLTPDDRELMTLIAWESLTPAEAAEVLGIPAGTVRVRLHRARTRLRAALSTSDRDQEASRDV
ncbi:RNA polymerase sigma factor [Blastococcus goldschmidtiae]|uniref:Sigma-70 family RNA polymerase sigma factor n=1 Tax=Blastococcus goldschmidtiae TaxID=3075546 RepID=A0ABU2K7F1_9ACTN|nr:sigma-70 family RNA polymerase sigma factor [Blastococcus sp. DSM 46792]MDT0276130.1 sigma-70 family RNA polymerase sigma factor [Blastococcus sp. DSM 46792]